MYNNFYRYYIPITSDYYGLICNIDISLYVDLVVTTIFVGDEYILHVLPIFRIE